MFSQHFSFLGNGCTGKMYEYGLDANVIFTAQVNIPLNIPELLITSEYRGAKDTGGENMCSTSFPADTESIYKPSSLTDEKL